MASRSHRRSPSRPHHEWRTALVSAAVVAAVALAVSLTLAFRPDGEPTAAHTTTTRTAKPQATAETKKPNPNDPPASSSPTASPSPTATKSPRPSPRTTTGKRPSPPKITARPASGTAPLADRIRPGVTYRGVATFYDTGDGNGACLYGPTSDVMTAAMNTTDYETSKACGAYIQVRAASGATVTVRITNECPAPCAPGQLDLSPQAFAKLAAPSAGQIPITWTLLSPTTSDTISLRYKTGSTRYWCGIQVVGHRNPVARLEVRTGTTWRELPRTKYNYFLSEQGSGCGGAIRITDIYGEALTVDGIGIRPDELQPTRVQFAAH